MNTENKRNTKNKVDLDMLFRSFNNVTTSDEERDICDWLNGNEENKKAYSTARDIHEAFLLEAPAELLEAHSPESARKRKKSLRIALQCIGYAAAIAMFCVIGYNVINDRVEDRLAKTMNTIVIPSGKSMDYILSDGTKVKLNSGAMLQYPVFFAKDKREVHLDGEAYFEVKHDERQPFIVKTFASDIKVLGTEFNVNADKSSGTFSVALVEGSVMLSNTLNPGEQIIMHPDEKVTLVKDHMVIQEYEASKDAIWTEGIIDISGIGFDTLIDRIEKSYGVDIIIQREDSPEIDCISGQIRISDGIDHAMNIICQLSGTTYRKDLKTGKIYIR